MAVWRINVKGEPPPQFSWWKDGGKLFPRFADEKHFSGRKIETSDEYQVESQEYQGGATAILQIFKTQVGNLIFIKK